MITLSVDDRENVTQDMKMMMQSIDPKGTHLTACNAHEAFEILKTQNIQVLFLDIEMPDMNGLEAAQRLKEDYPKLNVIFVTAHSKYSFQSHKVHPSGFLAKPVNEEDIRQELKNLRFPIEEEYEKEKCRLKVQCSPFAVFVDGQPFDFKCDRTIELFAYLIYRNGAICTNGELLGILYDGAVEKQGRLRQLTMDMRDCFREIGIENVQIKKYGKVGLNIHCIKVEGDTSKLIKQFNWY